MLLEYSVSRVLDINWFPAKGLRFNCGVGI